MVAVRLPNIDPEAFQKRLYDEFRIEIPVFLWNDLPLIRISVQGYNSSDDVDKVVTALKKLI
jgi:isopenicillin-N epimerase